MGEPNTATDRSTGTPIERTFEPFLIDKGKGRTGTSGNYRTDAERELDRFYEWLSGPGRTHTDETGSGEEPTTEDLDEYVFRAYARHLNNRDLERGTVLTYYAYVSSWCGWATREGLLSQHYARTSAARAPLPENDEREPGDQQAWTSEDRKAITSHVDTEFSRATDGLEPLDEVGNSDLDPHERARRRYAVVKAARDRVLAYVLCYTAVRGAEVLRDPEDERREGLQWGRVDLEERNVTVLRKKQRWDRAALPEQVIGPLESYAARFDPPTPEWPVFPTLHYPTLGRIVTDELAAQGYSDGAIEEIRADTYDLFVCQQFDLGPPPSITPDAARKRLRKLCADAGIELDDKHGYLAPHGGRRGMGEVLVRRHGYAEAARFLDNSEAMVRDRYSHIEAKAQASLATDAIETMDASDER